MADVDELIVDAGAVTGEPGAVLKPSTAARGVASSRNTFGEFDFRAAAVIVASGGIGGNHDLVRKNWPARMGRVPSQLLSGVPPTPTVGCSASPRLPAAT